MRYGLNGCIIPKRFVHIIEAFTFTSWNPLNIDVKHFECETSGNFSCIDISQLLVLIVGSPHGCFRGGSRKAKRMSRVVLLGYIDREHRE